MGWGLKMAHKNKIPNKYKVKFFDEFNHPIGTFKDNNILKLEKSVIKMFKKIK